jgi:NhaP-type Na+/H+ or K+/H+ antiporter
MLTELLTFIQPPETTGHDVHLSITVLIALLLIASVVAMAAKWVRAPYTLALVIVGLVISPMHFLTVANISPELILLIFLPALLFEVAWNLKLDHPRENLAPILTLATVGVAHSVGVIIELAASLIRNAPLCAAARRQTLSHPATASP